MDRNISSPTQHHTYFILTLEFKDTYKTILKNSKATLLKEKGSKFYAYAFSVMQENDIKNCLDLLKKRTSQRKTLVLCMAIRSEL